MKARLAIPAALLSVAVVALVAAGCGSDSKPEYCSDVSALQSSVDDLKNIQLNAGVIDTVKTDLKKVQTNADAAVASAKQDFPSETDSLKSAISTLSDSVDQLPAKPSATDLLSLAAQVSSVATAAQNFQSATKSACD